MILSDVDIRKAMQEGDIVIDPFDERMLSRASYSLTLGTVLYRLKDKPFIDSRESTNEYDEITLTDEGYLLAPGAFIIGRTREHIKLSDQIGCFVSNTGSRAQQGLDAILSSSFAEPGSDNAMACELHNVSHIPIKLYPGVKIAKAIFIPLHTPAEQKGRESDFFNRHNVKE